MANSSAPLPEDAPDGYELLHHARGSEFHEAATIDDLDVAVANDFRGEKEQATVKLAELVGGEHVVGKVGGPASHGEGC